MAEPKTFAVIDIETTGGRAKSEKITEIAILIFRNGKIIREYQSLINPERSIPPFITRITGIRNDMVAEAPKFFEIAKDIIQLTKGCIFVAHNVRFDYAFIQEEFKQLGYSFAMKKLCTLALSRKLIPGLKSYSLKNLCRHFEIPLVHHHRALDDAKATAALFAILSKIKGIDDWTSHLIKEGIQSSRLPIHIPKETIQSLPEAPGVYYFEDQDHQVIYVGKSIHIKKRVLQHFVKMTRKAEQLQSRAYHIHFERTGSELIAMLLESTEIKRLQPELNKSQKTVSLPHKLICYKNARGYLTLKIITSKNESAEHEYIKSFRSKNAAQQYLAWLTREFELCASINKESTNGKSCFLYSLEICRGACMGLEHPKDYNARVWTFIDSRPHFDQQDFLIVDSGRSADEKAIIAMKDGVYYGYGYISESELLMSYEDILDQISPQEHNDEVHSIIWYYLHKKKGLQVISQSE